MDQQEEGFFYSHHGACHADPSQGMECKPQSSVTAGKVHKADRERMRRDKLNVQFLELGTTLDPDCPRHDKATILGYTVQMLKDLTSQVNKLKAEYSSLFEEECELTQEINELRGEKTSLNSDVNNLNNHYAQSIQMLYPWTTMESSILIGPPPSYPFSVQVPIPTGAVTMHPQLQPCPFFQNQTLVAFSNPCTPSMASNQSCHAPRDQPSNQFSSPFPLPSSSQSHSPAQDCRSKSPTIQQASCGGRIDDRGDVATDLELKTPGSSAPSHSEITNKDSSYDLKRKKQCIKQINGSTLTGGSSSSRCSSNAPLNISITVGHRSVDEDH